MRANKRAANAALFEIQEKKKPGHLPRFFFARVAGSYIVTT